MQFGDDLRKFKSIFGISECGFRISEYGFGNLRIVNKLIYL